MKWSQKINNFLFLKLSNIKYNKKYKMKVFIQKIINFYHQLIIKSIFKITLILIYYLCFPSLFLQIFIHTWLDEQIDKIFLPSSNFYKFIIISSIDLYISTILLWCPRHWSEVLPRILFDIVLYILCYLLKS
jgi:hypothetical protein